MIYKKHVGKIRKSGFLTLVFFLISGVSSTDNPSAYEIANRMFARTKDINTLIYDIKKLELINGKMVEQHSYVKLNRNPYKVYTMQTFPKMGVEVLYIAGPKNKALINPNGFPWINIRLDPYGRIMRKGQHHTILDSGFDLVVSILEFLFNKYDEKIETMIEIKGTTQWEGYSCWVLEFNNPYFEHIKYTVKEGESIITIPDKFKLSEYMILEINKNLDDYYDVHPGQVIEIPNDYSPRMILYIDKGRLLPVVMKVYDKQGLFEHYEYTNILLEPDLKPEEFIQDYKEYKF